MAKHDIPDRRRSGGLEPLLTVNDAAAALRVSGRTVRRLIKRGELPALRVGNQLRLQQASFLTYVHGQLFNKG